MTDEELERLREAAREYAVRSRAEQGLPPTIDNPHVVAKIAELMGFTE